MVGACNCDRGLGVHHHGFGGSYPCEGDELCIHCNPIEVFTVGGSMPPGPTIAVNDTGEDEAVLPGAVEPLA